MPLLPRQSVLVRFRGDPTRWYERLVLKAVNEDEYVVATPELKMHNMLLTCPPLLGMMKLGARGGIPRGVDRSQVIRLQDVQGRLLTSIEVDTFINLAEKLVNPARTRIHEKRVVPPPGLAAVSWKNSRAGVCRP